MEQHLYTFLAQRYGLRSLVVEHASSIVRACTTLEGVDNDAALFLRVLR
jgi:hypothetical protein